MLKTQLYLQENSEVNFLIIEEPENSLSYTNMAVLVSELAKDKNKQLFVSTHSNFITNKLGLNKLQLIVDGILFIVDDFSLSLIRLLSVNTMKSRQNKNFVTFQNCV